jgi:hypothetical protein
MGGVWEQLALDGPEGRKAPTVDGAWAQPFHRIKMLGRWISFVFGEAIARIEPIKFQHEAVARHFGKHTGGGDGVTSSITPDNGGLREGKDVDGQTIHEHVLGRGIKLGERLEHGAMGGAQDIDGIDHLSIYMRDSKPDLSRSGESGEKIVALFRGELLGIVQATEGARQAGLPPVIWKNDRRSGNRAC